MTREKQQRQQRKFLLASNLLLHIRRPLRNEPGLKRGKELRRRGWRQTPLLVKRKSETKNIYIYIHTNLKHAYTHIHDIKFIQINLHHSKAATAIFCQ
jgi:hypothetical protein